MATPERPVMSLRERKKAKTRTAIQQHAVRLFLEQGYNATTVEQIAEAAEVSPSTFFRYFQSKEDVVLSDNYDPLIIAAFHEQPADQTPIQALRNALRSVYTNLSPDDLKSEFERGKLIFSIPELHGAFLNNLVQMISMFSEMIAKRIGRDQNDLQVRAYAGALQGVALSVGFHWIENPEVDLLRTLDEAFDFLEAGLPL